MVDAPGYDLYQITPGETPHTNNTNPCTPITDNNVMGEWVLVLSSTIMTLVLW